VIIVSVQMGQTAWLAFNSVTVTVIRKIVHDYFLQFIDDRHTLIATLTYGFQEV
jgi:hypothetical protein